MVSATLSIEAAAPSEAAQLAAIEQAVRLMRDVVRRPIPVGLSGASARRYVTLFSEAERVAASGVALFTPKVVESGEYTKDGDGSAAEWLGKLSGSSSGAAKGRLAAASRAAKDPLLTEALHEGELSSDQLKVVTTTLGEVPGATGELLKLVDEGASHKELSDKATQYARRRPQPRGRAAPSGPGPHQPPLSLGAGRQRAASRAASPVTRPSSPGSRPASRPKPGGAGRRPGTGTTGATP